MNLYEKTLIELAQRDESLIVMTAENRAPIRKLPGILPERFFDTGITEQTLVGCAAGFALRGRVPVAHALATFLTMRAFEFIRTDVGIPGLPVKLVGFVPGFLSEANGATHQAVEDVSLMRGIPGMKVVCPADEVELARALPVILEDESPCYIRYNTRPAPTAHPEPFAFGKAEVFSPEAKDVAVLTYGTLFTEAWALKDRLDARGLQCRLINCRSLKPVDSEALLDAAASCRLLVTVEDHFRTGGLYSILAETLMAHRMAANVLPLCLEDKWFSPTPLSSLLRTEGFLPEQMAERVVNAIQS